MGAAVIVMRNRGINPMESGLGLWIGLNLLITFTVSGISIGGHIGGLVGGTLAALVLFEVPSVLRVLPAWRLLCAGLGAPAAVGRSRSPAWERTVSGPRARRSSSIEAPRRRRRDQLGVEQVAEQLHAVDQARTWREK